MLFCGQQQNRAAAHQRDCGETGRRVFEERAGQAAEFADVPWPVILHPERRGTAGGVVAGGVLGLNQGHASVRGQMRGGGGAGDAGADDDNIVVRGLHVCPSCPRRRNAERCGFLYGRV